MAIKVRILVLCFSHFYKEAQQLGDIGSPGEKGEKGGQGESGPVGVQGIQGIMRNKQYGEVIKLRIF